MRPARMTATRSPTVSASVWSWVTNSAGVRVRAQDVDDVGAQPRAQVGVEAGERLVEQHQPRLRRQGPGQGDALALTAGQLVRVAVAVASEADDAEPVVAPLGARRPRTRRAGRT